MQCLLDFKVFMDILKLHYIFSQPVSSIFIPVA